jgi:hypothetical protein
VDASRKDQSSEGLSKFKGSQEIAVINSRNLASSSGMGSGVEAQESGNKRSGVILLLEDIYRGISTAVWDADGIFQCLGFIDPRVLDDFEKKIVYLFKCYSDLSSLFTRIQIQL